MPKPLPQILPCMWCGGKLKVEIYWGGGCGDSDHVFYPTCENQGCRFNGAFAGTKNEAIENYNRVAAAYFAAKKRGGK